MMHKINCPVQKAADTFGAYPAIIADKAAISYKQLCPMVASLAFGLGKKGLRGGQRIGIIADTCWEYVVLLQALLRLGAVVCPVSPRFADKGIVELLETIGCCTVIDFLGRLSSAVSKHIRKMHFNDVRGCLSWDHEGCGGSPGLMTDLDADATIVWTSGTSGSPKAALHSYGNHYYSAVGANDNISVEPGDRWLLTLPLYHVGGLGIVFRMLLGGGTVVIPKTKEKIGETVEQWGITHVSLVATQLYRWLKEGMRPKTIGRLKAVLVGGGPVHASLIRRGLKAGLPLFTTYGSTEMASQVTTTAPGDPEERLYTSGKVLEYRDAKIDREEILVKGKTLFKGYVAGSETVLPTDNGGWFRTGDLGRLDGRGYLTCFGRKDNMFISGGENIVPEEIERQLSLLPHVVEAVVVAGKDKEFGYRPVAFVRMERGKSIDPAHITSSLEDSLPRFKIPVAFYKWPEHGEKEGIKPDRQYLARLAQSLRRR
jgi:o-succinylbenzoate---CoA ligase